MSRFNSDRLKLELRRARTPALQYLFIVACTIFTLAIFFKNQFFDAPWVSKHSVQAQFEDVKGVTPGAQRVRIAGVDVGIITDSKVGKDGKPVLTLRIEDEHGDIYKDAQMRLRPLTPLQDIYVDITDRGTPAAGKLEEDDVLAGGRTVSPVDVSRVLNTFDQDTRVRMRTLFTEFERGLSADGGDQLKESFAQLAPFLKAAQRTTETIAERRQNMKRLVHNLAELTNALGERDEQLTRLVRDGNRSLAELASVQEPFDATLRALPDTMTTLRSSFAALRSAEDELDPALRALGPVADNLKSGLQALETFAVDARPALASLREPVRELSPLANELKPTAENLSQAFTRLSPQAPQLDSITAELPRCFDMAGKFFNNTLSVFKFSDDFGSFPRGENESDGSSAPGDKNPNLSVKRVPRCTESKP